MIPQTEGLIITEIEEEEQITRTYKLNPESLTIVGMTDGIDAMRQYVLKVLNTERYKNIIYSWDYGAELTDLIGEPDTYAIPEIERRICDALLRDDRILSVEDFDFKNGKGGVVTASFTVHTVYGDIEEERTVTY